MNPLVVVSLFVLGLAIGCAVNVAIYALAWNARPISPWQQPHPEAPGRRLMDFVPVIGWLGLRREAHLHGSGFWIRPLLLELASAIGLPTLYWWEISKHLAPDLPIVHFVAATPAMLQQQFFSHAILMTFMLVASFIDFDEKTIPDEITIPGTLIGLLLAAWLPNSHLPVVRLIAGPAGMVNGYAPLLATSTSEWPAWLNGSYGLMLGSAIFVAWCVALIPALATLRRGWWKGVRFYFASIARESGWWKLLILAAIGSGLIAAVWRNGGESWQALLTSLIGLAFGGGAVWSVRIAGRLSLGKEAMGFGDVTLLAMIGAFLGWQSCLMIFFISPFLALPGALVKFVLTGHRDLPYGPFLCAASVIVIVKWPALWNNFQPLFAVPWLLPTVLAVCLVLMVALLTVWRIIERSIFAR